LFSFESKLDLVGPSTSDSASSSTSLKAPRRRRPIPPPSTFHINIQIPTLKGCQQYGERWWQYAWVCSSSLTIFNYLYETQLYTESRVDPLDRLQVAVGRPTTNFSVNHIAIFPQGVEQRHSQMPVTSEAALGWRWLLEINHTNK
jgi:hypothetical protein